LRVVNSPPQAQPEASTREVLAGLVERVTFHNAENGFCVLRIKARGHRELITVIGHAAVIAAGEWVTASGEWVNDRTHGQQFKSRFMRTSAPTTALDLELAERTVIADTVGETACIFLAGLYRAEQVIAERILRLVNGTLPSPADPGWGRRPSSTRSCASWPPRE
jgi:hypothetical protein